MNSAVACLHNGLIMFDDAVRDIVTNLRGTFEMLENVASQLRTPDTRCADRDMNGKVLYLGLTANS